MQTLQKHTLTTSFAVGGRETFLPEQPRAPDENRFSKRIANVADLRSFFEKNAAEIREKAGTLCRAAADEAMQELFPRMAKFLANNPQGIDNPWGLTHTMLARFAIDRFRTLKRNRERVKRLEFPDSVPDRDGESVSSDQLDSLQQALNGLSPRLRLIVSGIFIEGCKARDVARRVGLSESRLSELKQVALAQLREVLE